MKSRTPEKVGKFYGLGKRIVIRIFLLNFLLWTGDILFHSLSTPFAELLFRIFHTLFIIYLFLKHSPVPFSPRNRLLSASVFLATAYPFQSQFFGNAVVEMYLEVLMPLLSNALLIVVFILERKKSEREPLWPDLSLRALLFIFLPAGYYYFVVYHNLRDTPFFLLTLFYTLLFMMLMLTGSRLKLRRENQTIILAGLMLTVLATVLNTYSIFVEQLDNAYAVICFLTMFINPFFLWGLVNEDIIRKAGR